MATIDTVKLEVTTNQDTMTMVVSCDVEFTDFLWTWRECAGDRYRG